MNTLIVYCAIVIAASVGALAFVGPRHRKASDFLQDLCLFHVAALGVILLAKGY